MKTLTILPDSGVFVENKEAAQRWREQVILPALERGETVVLDFQQVQYATQSFIHALISEPLKRYHERALDLIEFRHCSPALRSVIEWVVDYSLGGFQTEEMPAQETKKAA